MAATKQARIAPYLGLLAAGPMEDLLGLHGAQFIDRIEIEAAENHVLGRV